MFFIRLAFWLGLVVAFIPVQSDDLPDGMRSVSPLETIGLAKSVAGDVASFCNRNEDTCVTGSLLLAQMGVKAREGARIASGWLDDKFGPESSLISNAEKTMLDPVETGSLEN